MRVEYDAETDILTVRLREDPPDHGSQSDNIITHYRSDGTPVELEILDARETMLELLGPMLAGFSGRDPAASASGASG